MNFTCYKKKKNDPYADLEQLFHPFFRYLLILKLRALGVGTKSFSSVHVYYILLNNISQKKILLNNSFTFYRNTLMVTKNCSHEIPYHIMSCSMLTGTKFYPTLFKRRVREYFRDVARNCSGTLLP